MEDYNDMIANQVGGRVELHPFCVDSKPGTALWVQCASPECGTKPKKTGLRRKRNQQTEQYYVDHYPHSEEPHFQTTPEAMEFVKNFFNSMSLFDRKKFYKRLWGPLVHPYMGIKDTTTDPQEHEENGPRIPSDPSQSSWQTYLRPYHRTIDSFDPNNFFPNYQEAMHYGRLNSYDFVPAESYNYQNYPEHYMENYYEPYSSQNYIRRLRETAGESYI